MSADSKTKEINLETHICMVNRCQEKFAGILFLLNYTYTLTLELNYFQSSQGKHNPLQAYSHYVSFGQQMDIRLHSVYRRKY